MQECEYKHLHGPLFRGLLEQTLTNTEKAALIRVMLQLASKEVGRQIGSRYWRLDRLGLTQDDVANDSMALLLASIGGKPCERLRRSLAAICPSPPADGSLCNYVHGIVKRCVQQEFYRILSEDDSTHTRLLRALDRHKKDAQGLKQRDSSHGLVYSRAAMDVLNAQPFMPVDELLRRIPHHLPLIGDRATGSNGGHPTNPAVHVLAACLQVLDFQEEYRREVSEKDVMQLTTMWIAGLYESGEGETSEHGFPEREENELLAGIEAALDTTGAWVRVAYVGKGKLTMPVAEAMLGAIREWISACLIGIAEEPAVYFRRNEGMSSAEYRARYRSIYLSIVNRFRDELRTAWNRRR